MNIKDELAKMAQEPRGPYVTLPILRGYGAISTYDAIAQQYGALICGGYARYCASTNPDFVEPHDIDIFPMSDEASKRVIAEILKLPGHKKAHATSFATTIQLPKDDVREVTSLQVINPLKKSNLVTVGSAEDILENFDFTICKAAIINSREVLAHPDFERDERFNLLRLSRIHCPLTAIRRIGKYVGLGYTISFTEIMKLFVDWDARGPEYKKGLMALVDNEEFDNDDYLELQAGNIDDLVKAKLKRDDYAPIFGGFIGK